MVGKVLSRFVDCRGGGWVGCGGCCYCEEVRRVARGFKGSEEEENHGWEFLLFK